MLSFREVISVCRTGMEGHGQASGGVLVVGHYVDWITSVTTWARPFQTYREFPTNELPHQESTRHQTLYLNSE